eukprot:4911105-Amphidinium_carterae.1
MDVCVYASEEVLGGFWWFLSYCILSVVLSQLLERDNVLEPSALDDDTRTDETPATQSPTAASLRPLTQQRRFDQPGFLSKSPCPTPRPSGYP